MFQTIGFISCLAVLSVGQASPQSDKADGAAEQPIPDEVLALVPMFIRWAAGDSPLPGFPYVKCNESCIRDAVKNKSVKTIYVAWLESGNHVEDVIVVPYKYDLTTAKVSRTTMRGLNDAERRKGESVEMSVSKTNDDKTANAGITVDGTLFDFALQRVDGEYRVIKQGRPSFR